MMVHASARMQMKAQESHSFPPMGSAHRWRRRALRPLRTFLQSKGFVGGVPQNTETAAVNPRAGIE